MEERKVFNIKALLRPLLYLPPLPLPRWPVTSWSLNGTMRSTQPCSSIPDMRSGKSTLNTSFQIRILRPRWPQNPPPSARLKLQRPRFLHQQLVRTSWLLSMI
ncbi:hypothetical protein I7I53_03480 [Histoplasma capsulatum var. duboisii H88]|uniref:Uncharacterized protein n=1 Tax=Ajellomyces capsulatus (strain H88) TaxID=544711 RepID=A0A8A1LUD2_AJEC8|nr:hypothetical protein I7I53_03480 [Histoplasma capsulatum var. duboisii H88]